MTWNDAKGVAQDCELHASQRCYRDRELTHDQYNNNLQQLYISQILFFVIFYDESHGMMPDQIIISGPIKGI